MGNVKAREGSLQGAEKIKETVRAKQRGDTGESGCAEWMRGMGRRHDLWKGKKGHMKLKTENPRSRDKSFYNNQPCAERKHCVL